VLNRNDRYSFNLERGDTIKIPAGTITYLANLDDKEDLRVLDLVIPVNRPGQFQVILLHLTILIIKICSLMFSFCYILLMYVLDSFHSLSYCLEVKTKNPSYLGSARTF
jgi:hypothetical protein